LSYSSRRRNHGPGSSRPSGATFALALFAAASDAARRNAAITVAISAFIFVMIPITPWPQLLVSAAVLPVGPLSAARQGCGHAFFVLGVVLMPAMLIDSRPWLPAEEVTAGGEATVGYVLSEDDRAHDEGRQEGARPEHRRPSRGSGCVARLLGTAGRTLFQIILGDEGGPRNPPCTDP
jgi:hypothetical protein